MPDLQAAQDSQAFGNIVTGISTMIGSAIMTGALAAFHNKKIEGAANSAPPDVLRRLDHLEKVEEENAKAHSTLDDKIAGVALANATGQAALMGEMGGIRTGIERLHTDVGKIQDILLNRGGSKP